uniref:RIMS-binding protein 2 n=1 Tax=Denticeps clupeoides TaxID=299321 RepID=A0AAY4A0E4_9TELE
MREAAEQRQQLEVEHAQALAILSSKQQELDLLQEAQTEVEKGHKGAVHVLEVRVRDLEQKCRSQCEQFNLLSKELHRYQVEADAAGAPSSRPFATLEVSHSPEKATTNTANGLPSQAGKGDAASPLIAENQRGLQTTRDKPELLSVKPTVLTRSRPTSPQRATPSEMDDEVSPSPRSKPRYTGQVRLCTARYSYNPYDGPNEHPEAELPLVAGKYLYVYGNMDDDGFYEGELLDGQRGLVPSNFVEFVQDKEKQSLQLGDSGEDLGIERGCLGLSSVDRGGPLDSLSLGDSLGPCSNGMGPLDPEDLANDVVPYPRKINLIKQLARSVIVAWDPPLVPLGWGTVSGYNILVDGEVRSSVPFGSRTKMLLEKLDLSGCTYRVSVQSATDRGLSDELRCSLLVGRNVTVAPTGMRVDNILRDSAELSWLPSNSNYAHIIYLDGVEQAVVKPGCYRYRFVNLKATTVYKVRVLAKPHQMPWQLPLEQREKKETGVEFCTQAAGPPLPPQEVQVQCGQAPGILQVRWKPPLLTSLGTSNGANVIGYAVCTKGQKIAEVLFPLADYVSVELNRIQCLEAREVVVRTLSAQGESQDSPVASIPPKLLLQPLPHPPHPMPQPQIQPLSARELETKEPGLGMGPGQPWESVCSPSGMPPPPMHGHSLEAPVCPNRRSPSPQRILPQPRGTLIPDTVAKAIAREAAQRVAAESGRVERRSQPFHPQNSDEDEDEEGYGSSQAQRRGTSVDEFLRGSELGRQSHYSHSEEYHTESSRGSDLSDIMEEDEEELYSEMQLEEGRRRNSHNTMKNLQNTPSGRGARVEGRRSGQSGPQPQRRPLTVPSIDGYRDRGRRSPAYYDESEPEEPFRIFVALFDYDPLSMSPNPDAADEELPFKEGQIIRVYGDKDTDGFYRGEIGERSGLIPCNMVSEIRAEDEETMDSLIKQGFLSLNTPVDRIEQNRRGGRHPMATRRMVALYDYDPRESSPNVDVEAELTFCAGDIISVFGEIDEDGFYYGELNGHRGLVPSNFLEEVPDDVEVYLTENPPPNSHTGTVKKQQRSKSDQSDLTL